MEIETLAEIEINEIDKIGPKGLSAYEVYVKNGGTLSEIEWLKSLRGEQGPQGKPGAVKMQVVDTLPDVGETDTIYLLKKDTPGEQNLYDEYVYTETTGWEHIGDTSVDLTDYYNKDETDEKLNNIAYSLDLLNSDFSNLNSLDYQKINDYVNYCKDIDRWVPIKLSTRDYKNGELPIFNIHSSANFANIVFSFITIKANNNFETLFTFEFYGSWEEDGYHVSGSRNYRKDDITPLYRNNTRLYTPTQDYHPATKKYVDDNKYTLPVASAETLGGIKLGEGLSADENGVVSANVENIPEVYVDSLFPGGQRPITDTIFLEKLETLINKYKDKSYTIKKIACFVDFTSNQTYPYYMSFSCPSKIMNTRTSYNFHGDVKLLGVFNDKRQCFTSQVIVNGNWIDDIFHITSCYIIGVPENIVMISIDNTYRYTPTGDYNPSTKLYTDKTHYENMTGYDATKTQVLKNISGTLTWVDEG